MAQSNNSDAPRALRVLIASDPLLQDVLAAVRDRMRYDSAHDLGHLVRVARWTLRLLDEIPGGDEVDSRLAIAAALLHDVANVPKNERGRQGAGPQSAQVAAAVLAECGVPPAEIRCVAEAIRDHSYLRGAVPRSPLAIALQDADRLEALGILGTFRCIATGAQIGAAFVDMHDPWAERRPLDDRAFSLDHFFKKLLLLPSTLVTEAGRAEAERRAERMVAVLRGLGEELEAPFEAAAIRQLPFPDFQADGFSDDAAGRRLE